ncbi:hypothetical protein GGH98_005666 [Coemansia sp. RSA 454]|nr:hypothetical protein GGH98_005666 [Coemansia sp. RSA 454]
MFRRVKQSDGYTPPVRSDPTDLDSLLIRSFENTALFLVSSFQYILVAIVFSIGPPYRQSNLRNRGLVITCILLVVFTTYVVLQPTEWISNVFEMVDLSTSFRRTIIVWALANFAMSWVGETWLFPWLAPNAAKYARIACYIIRRFVFRSEYTQVPMAELGNSGAPNKRRAADNTDSLSTTVNECDLEDARREPTWEEISQKSNIKPFKRILRDMGIPSWY